MPTPVPGPFAVPTRYDGAPDRVAVVVPGVGYTPAMPLLHFARAVLLQHGWTVQELWWRIPDDFSRFGVEERIAWVEAEVTRAVDAEAGACRLVVGKSLGSLGCGVVAERDIAAAWLTPVLTIDQVVRGLRRAQAPTLLVGGGADKLWDSGVAGSSGHEVLEIPGADHSLELAGDARGSVDVLGEVVSRLDQFVGSLGR
ncbi:alpha/beta hydrolase [Streptomyces hokutonensis]|uniref:alpha/beta hydrolase n=1 Tax=Streptomyces hokutonensis TaxID=1306990 RepID=UPI0007C53456|nr:alpha/beta hydrolase [Streptomyces hokutonensis]